MLQIKNTFTVLRFENKTLLALALISINMKGFSSKCTFSTEFEHGQTAPEQKVANVGAHMSLFISFLNKIEVPN